MKFPLVSPSTSTIMQTSYSLVQKLFTLFILVPVIVGCNSNNTIQEESPLNRESDFNFDWKFRLLTDTIRPAELPLEDAHWRDIRLPHDWSVEASFDSTLEGCTGYLPGGIGVYQKHFVTPPNSNASNTYVLFDGVYNNATFWLNGKRLGENPYGYSPMYFDLTDKLNEEDKENILTVYVDHSRYADSRWYTGSGIYRNVKLITVDKLHIPVWGTFITTPKVSENQASITLEVSVENLKKQESSFTLSTVILDKNSKQVAKSKEELKLSPNTKKEFKQTFSVTNPKLWDTDNPNMYSAVTSIMHDGKLIDKYRTPFGIRSLRFDKDEGFFLNGKPTYAKGVCLHHDGGLVGAAVPKGVWRRRLQKLKEGGVNAIRTAHNPFSEEFLNLCDEMGFLVQNEIFDEMDNPKDKRYNLNEREVDYITRGYTEHFQKWGESDLKRTILRDRNHPSVFMWSIGNEIEWTYPHYKHVSGLWDKNNNYWNKIPTISPNEMKARYEALPDREYTLTKTAQRLSGWVKELDTTRPVTSNLIIPVASLATGYANVLDVVGVSYQIAQYPWMKEHYPNVHITGNENSGYLSEWQSILDNPGVFSMYMWTGIDYMGETNKKWPQKAWHGDMLDLGGFEQAGFYNFKSIWIDDAQVSITTTPLSDSKFEIDKLSGELISKKNKVLNWDNYSSQMHWNYTKGQKVLIEVRSNLPSVELFLNDVSLGTKKLADCTDRIFRWAVPYEDGILRAIATSDDSEVTALLKTASEPVKIKLITDQKEIKADGYDVAHLVVQLVDEHGTEVKTIEKEVQFKIEGDARLLGVDNGWNKSTQDFQSDKVITHKGRCLAIIQSNLNSGIVKVKVKVNDLPEESISINVVELK